MLLEKSIKKKPFPFDNKILEKKYKIENNKQFKDLKKNDNWVHKFF